MISFGRIAMGDLQSDRDVASDWILFASLVSIPSESLLHSLIRCR